MDTIKQAWAEAVHIWKNEKPQLILPEAYMQEAKELQEANMADDGKRGLFRNTWKVKHRYVLGNMGKSVRGKRIA